MNTTEPTPQLDLSDTQLNRLHDIQLDIVRRVKQICDAHGLEYFLIAGTLLGAVRHGGFIPWDDDMDVGMPRASYDRFLQVAPHELGPDFFVQTLETDPGYGLSFAKVRLNGTALVEASSAKTAAHTGIFLDVFPFDNVPNSEWQRKLHSSVTTGLKRTILLHQKYTPWFNSGRLKSWLHQSAVPFARAIPMAFLVPLLEKSMRLFNNHTTERLTAIGGSYGYNKESIRREWLKTLPEKTFEGLPLRCPVGSHEYLTNLYGKYQTLPPIENRNSRHGIISLDFHRSTPSRTAS